MSTIERAIEIAARAHSGQVDKAGNPYILHPIRLMLAMQSDEERIVAVLHDVVEDSQWTLEQLRQEGFTPRIVEAVDAVTKRDGETYVEFIERAGANDLAIRVKIADLRDNMELTRIAEPTARDMERIRRYERALSVLESMLPADGTTHSSP